MTRRQVVPGIFGATLLTAAFVGFVATAPDRPATAYDRCIAAANTPGPTGFATEVCEPLLPGYVEPKCVTYEDGSVECSRVWDPDTREWRDRIEP